MRCGQAGKVGCGRGVSGWAKTAGKGSALVHLCPCALTSVIPSVAWIGHRTLAAAQPRDDESAVEERREAESRVDLPQLVLDHLKPPLRAQCWWDGDGLGGEEHTLPTTWVVVRWRVVPQALLSTRGRLERRTSPSMQTAASAGSSERREQRAQGAASAGCS